MIEIPLVKVKNISFPEMNLKKGDWVSFNLPENCYDVMLKYIKHIEGHTSRFSFLMKKKKKYKVLNLTSNNEVFFKGKKLETLINQQNTTSKDKLLKLTQDILKVSPSIKINEIGLTKRLIFLYALEKEMAEIIVTTTAGLDPLGKDLLYETLIKDKEDNIVIELNLRHSGSYKLSNHSKVIEL